MQERGADEGELLEDAHGDNVHASSVVGSAQPSDAEANTGEEACGHALADAADSSAVESDSDQAAPPVPATFAWGAELPAIQEAGTSGRVGTYGYLAGKHDQNDVPLPVVGGLESGVSSESLRHYKEIEPWPVTPTGHPALSKEAQIGQVAGLVAGALERVAQRLRSGELRLPEEPPPTSDESALATALAALLRGTER